MRINKLKLSNFRCFETYEMELSERFTLLIGDNGSGKTAILDAIASVLSDFLGEFQDRVIPSDLRKLSNNDIHYSFSIMGQNPIKQSNNESLNIQVEVFFNDKILIHKVSKRLLDFYQPPILSDTAGYGITSAETLLPLLVCFSTERLWKKPNDYEVQTLGPDSRLLGYRDCLNSVLNLERLFRWFKTQEFAALQKKERRHVLEAVRGAIVSMIPNANTAWWDIDWDELLIETVIQGEAKTIPFHLLSDGYRNLIGLAADIAYRMATLNPQLQTAVIKQTEGIVLIDEIDLHLHPKWQRQVVGRLLDTFPKVQFVASSHSPFIIQSLYHREDVLLWDLEKAQAVDITSKSIEDIAEDQQGVEIPQQSQRFLDMEKAAEEYYSALKQIPIASEDEKQRLRQRLDKLLMPYSDDPAFQAFLKMERLAVEGNGGE